jgi:uncharacterized protein
MNLTLLAIFLTGIVSGAFGSMLGIGGAMILVPVITLFLGVPIKVAIGASIVSVIAVSSAAQIVYVGRGLTHTRLGMVLELATSIGAILGGVTAVLVSAKYLQGLFAAILLWGALSMYRGRGHESEIEPTGLMDQSYEDPSTGEVVAYGVRRLPVGLGLSFVAGNLSGLLGIGGGAIKVPAMSLFMNVPLKAAIATSNFAIGVTAATSAAIYYGKGYMDPAVAAPTALGILIGGLIGSRVGTRLPAKVLRAIFAVVLLVFAVQMVWAAVT